MVRQTTELASAGIDLVGEGVALTMQEGTQEGTQEGAQAGVEALMQSGIGTMIQFGLLAIAVFLSVGSLFAIGAAGMARMSQDTSRQAEVGGYVKSAGFMLACAVVLGAGPEILTALGFETFRFVSPVNVFGG